MTHDWNAFLSQQGAIVDSWGVTHFSDQPLAPASTEETWLCDLNHQGLLALTGPDAVKFLQGQVTCDVRDLQNQHSLLGAQCDLKGRVLASFRAFQQGDANLFLRLHKSLLEETRAALHKYIVFSKATLVDISEQWCHIGVAGPSAEQLLSSHVSPPPEQVGYWAEAKGHKILQLGPQRYECWIAPDQAQAIWLALAEHCQRGGSNAWTMLDIRDGIAEVRSETRGLFTPQELNYPLIDAVSFRKGCYTGQEIVARLHYKAKLKSALYRFNLPLVVTGQLPPPGNEFPGPDTCPSPGKVVMAALATNDIAEALIVAKHAVADADWLNQSSEKLRRLSLPYAIPRQDEPLLSDNQEQDNG